MKIAKTHFHGVLLYSYILFSKIPEFWRFRLWDQNFVLFYSGNIHIKESTKPVFTFSFELRTKFVWSHGLLLLVPECYFAEGWNPWNFKSIFLRMQFSLVATFFLYFWLSVWVEICILNFLMSFQHLYHLTFGDKSVRVLDFHIWN